MHNIDFAKIIQEEMQKYANVTTEEMARIAKEVAKEGNRKLKEQSPRGSGAYEGHYADEWRIKEVQLDAMSFTFVVHNKGKYRLTHLLEFGHQLRQGGRARPYPHIKKINDWCIREFEKRVEEMLNG